MRGASYKAKGGEDTPKAPRGEAARRFGCCGRQCRNLAARSVIQHDGHLTSGSDGLGRMWCAVAVFTTKTRGVQQWIQGTFACVLSSRHFNLSRPLFLSLSPPLACFCHARAAVLTLASSEWARPSIDAVIRCQRKSVPWPRSTRSRLRAEEPRRRRHRRGRTRRERVSVDPRQDSHGSEPTRPLPLGLRKAG